MWIHPKNTVFHHWERVLAKSIGTFVRQVSSLEMAAVG
jgi:hypothetical protein